MNWKEEYQKCKEDKAYFFKNYCLVNGKKPTEYTVANFKEYIKDVKQTRRTMLYKARRPNHNMMPLLTYFREHPITPEEVFPQVNLLE